MLSGIRILDLDGSLLRQHRLIGRYKPDIVGMRDLESTARLWASRRTARIIRSRIGHDTRGMITFTGSGEYHHLSAILARQFPPPINLIAFDHHPDWDLLWPRLGCGSWVRDLLARGPVEKAVLFGVSSGDISSWSLQTGDLASLGSGRLELFPYSHGPSWSFPRRLAANACCTVEKGRFSDRISWEQIRVQGMEKILAGVLRRMRSRKVYLSIDKDCLTGSEALTNREPGLFPLAEVVRALQAIGESLDIIGCDITGDYSLPRLNGTLKRTVSRFDHPREPSSFGRTARDIDETNERANITLLEALQDFTTSSAGISYEDHPLDLRY
ncbi:MAG: arginase family protein [Deltaproteobacteria bacterium]